MKYAAAPAAAPVAWIGLLTGSRFYGGAGDPLLPAAVPLEHELDRPFEFTVTGSLKPLYTEKDIAAAQKAAEMGAAAGYDVVRILAPEDAWEKEPAMRGNGMIGRPV